jgi:hypothetical protein
MQHFKPWNSFTFFYFSGPFLPSWIRIQNSIKCGSGRNPCRICLQRQLAGLIRGYGIRDKSHSQHERSTRTLPGKRVKESGEWRAFQTYLYGYTTCTTYYTICIGYNFKKNKDSDTTQNSFWPIPCNEVLRIRTRKLSRLPDPDPLIICMYLALQIQPSTSQKIIKLISTVLWLLNNLIFHGWWKFTYRK